MKYSRGLTSILLLTICSVGATCTPSGGSTTGDQIALFTKNQTNPYFQSIRLGAESAASQMNAGVVHYVPTKPDSIPEQMSQIEDAIIKQPKAVVFIPVDFKAMVPGVQKLNAAKIPVVNLTDRSAGGDFVSFVGCDDERLGLSAGRYLLRHLNGNSKVIIIEGVGGSANSAARVRGFEQAIREFSGVTLLASQPGNFQRLQALQVTENLLQAHTQIDGVLAANDAMALGAVEALDAANRKAAVVGINGTKEAVDAIKAGKLLATVDCNGFEQGCIGVMTAIRHLRNLPVPKEFAFPQPVIDRMNYGDLDVPDARRSCPMWEDLVKG
jgi:ribose transport system substrate-binding protein